MHSVAKIKYQMFVTFLDAGTKIFFQNVKFIKLRGG